MQDYESSVANATEARRRKWPVEEGGNRRTVQLSAWGERAEKGKSGIFGGKNWGKSVRKYQIVRFEQNRPVKPG